MVYALVIIGVTKSLSSHLVPVYQTNENMRAVILIICVIALSHYGYTQAYMTSAGLRAGTDWGLTVQQRISKSATLEGIVQSSLKREEVMVTLLAEQHYPVLFRGFNIYFGGGFHKGWLSQTSDNESVLSKTEDPFGISLVGGAEITLGRINISYDFKPSLNIKGGEQALYPQTGISVRYAILDNKVYKDMVKKKKKKKRAEEGGIFSGDNWKIWKKKE